MRGATPPARLPCRAWARGVLARSHAVPAASSVRLPARRTGRGVASVSVTPSGSERHALPPQDRTGGAHEAAGEEEAGQSHQPSGRLGNQNGGRRRIAGGGRYGGAVIVEDASPPLPSGMPPPAPPPPCARAGASATSGAVPLNGSALSASGMAVSSNGPAACVSSSGASTC